MNGKTPGAGLNPLGEDLVSWARLHVAVDDTGPPDLQFPFPIRLGKIPAMELLRHWCHLIETLPASLLVKWIVNDKPSISFQTCLTLFHLEHKTIF